MKALIDNGRFSGKQEFVYSITKAEWSKESLDLIKDGYCYSIDLTEHEYNHIKNINDCIDVLYNEFGKSIEEKFYY
jgi:hypothetical protein